MGSFLKGGSYLEYTGIDFSDCIMIGIINIHIFVAFSDAQIIFIYKDLNFISAGITTLR